MTSNHTITDHYHKHSISDVEYQGITSNALTGILTGAIAYGFSCYVDRFVDTAAAYLGKRSGSTLPSLPEISVNHGNINKKAEASWVNCPHENPYRVSRDGPTTWCCMNYDGKNHAHEWPHGASSDTDLNGLNGWITDRLNHPRYPFFIVGEVHTIKQCKNLIFKLPELVDLYLTEGFAVSAPRIAVEKKNLMVLQAYVGVWRAQMYQLPMTYLISLLESLGDAKIPKNINECKILIEQYLNMAIKTASKPGKDSLKTLQEHFKKHHTTIDADEFFNQVLTIRDNEGIQGIEEKVMNYVKKNRELPKVGIHFGAKHTEALEGRMGKIFDKAAAWIKKSKKSGHVEL